MSDHPYPCDHPRAKVALIGLAGVAVVLIVYLIVRNE